MKIYINGRFLSQRITGVQRYAREMVTAIDKILAKEDNQNEWYLLTPNNIVGNISLSVIKIKKCGSLNGHIWEQLELPWYARDGFLLNFCNCAPLFKRKQLVTIHDAAVAAYPNAYSWNFRTWYKIMFYICGKCAEKIATVSNFSKNELHRYFSIPLDKIIVTYNGIDHMEKIIEDDSIVKELNLYGEKFVLAVSSQNPTKNFSLVLKTAKLMPETKFVIVGGSNKTIFAAENHEKMSNVIYTGYISDEKLISLYRHASVFVYPSLYEGFGIPPIEALSQGCPVIVSDCASLPEVCGDFTQYCNGSDEKIMCKKIKDVLSENVQKKYMIDDIREKYSWDKSAGILFKCIKLLYG